MTRTPLPLDSESPLRYLRGRGNRRVRKANRLRNAVRAWRPLVWNVAVTALVLFVGIRALTHVTSSASFALRSITVEGTRRTTPERVRASLAGFEGQNLLQLDLDELAERCSGDPWVRDASVKRMLPHGLRVSVVERTPAALALVGGLVVLVDDSGAVIGPVGPDLVEDLPVLTGLEHLSGAPLRAALARGARALERLRASSTSFYQGLSELVLSQEDRVEAVTRAPGPRILLDPEEVERNVASYLELARDLEREAGPVAMVDLRWRGRIAVLPKVTERESE